MSLRNVFFHLLIWILGISPFIIFGEDLTINYFKEADGHLFIPLIYGTVFNALIFYGNAHFLIPKYLGRNLYLKYLGGLVGLFFMITLIESGIDDYLIRQYYPELNLPFWVEHFGVNAFFHLFILISSYTYRFAADWIRDKRLQAQLREEKLNAELSLLKSQIHPHFLFNTLNNLFALARKQQAYETADGIAQLAELMRYMIYETDVDKITLNKEIEYLRNYIELQRMRFHEDDQVEIIFECQVEKGYLPIAPMLLLTFVENAFKHGISLQIASYIHIRMEVTDNTLLFSVKNSLPTTSIDKKDMGSGIGMVNVKKRLSILYPSKHHLQIDAGDNTYEIILKLELT